MPGRIGAYLRQNVLGLVAIFLALSAGAYAVQKAPKNSVVSKSIKDGQVKSADIGDGEVTGADVDEASLSGVPGANGGTVSSVGSGGGLTGGPITGAGTLALAPCPTDQILKSTGGGVYSCQADADTDTTYTAALGGGLSLSGANAFSVQSCPAGRMLRATSLTTWGCSNNFWGAAGSGLGATPNVNGAEVFTLNNGSPTAVTNLVGGDEGQRVTLLALNANTSIVDGGLFTLTANWTPSSFDTLTLINFADSWFEVARSDN
jgi:hypothetical protein